VSINANGNVTYTPNADFNGSDSFTYTNADGQTETVSVTINPIDDPTIITQIGIVGPITGDVKEDLEVTNAGQLSYTGKVEFIDPDEGTVFSPIVDFKSTTSSLGQLGDLIITSEGAWEYTVPNADVQFLDEGETVVEVFTITVNGTSRDITATIKGAEDPTFITVEAGDSATANITEDTNTTNGKLTSTGSLTFSDADTTDSENFVPTQAFSSANTGNELGSFVVNSDGTWSYEVDNEAIQYLDEGEAVTQTYTVTLNGVTQDVVITINGVDEPIAVDDGITAINNEGAPISGLYAQYWGYDEPAEGSNLSSLSVVNNYIANNPEADIEFISTQLDYQYAGSRNLANNVNSDGISDNLVAFLGDDGDSVVAIGDGSSSTATDGIIKFSGSLDVEEAGTYLFTVTHDDGFQLLIDGVDVFSFTGITATVTSVAEIALTTGTHEVELVYWDQGGVYDFDLTMSLNGIGDNVWVEDNLTYTDITTTIDNAITLDLITNDEGDNLEINAVGEAQHGSVEIVGGEVIYNPNAGYTGSDSFTYSIKDASGSVSNTATVYLTVLHTTESGVITDVIEQVDTAVYSFDANQVEIADEDQSLEGDHQANTLNGGSGNDIIDGDSGNDTLNGNAGNDTLFGGTNNDTLNGGDNDDTLYGGTNNDVLNGDAGNDTLFGEGNNDSLSGGSGDDTLDGGEGRDTLDGGLGNDILTGGTGDDILSGGEGSDTFTWTSSDTYGTDTITDFNENEDTLDLSDLLQGESESTLGNYLSINFDGTDTTITTFKDGGYSPTQKIVLEDTKLEGITETGDITGSEKELVINNLYSEGALFIDSGSAVEATSEASRTTLEQDDISS